MEEIFAVLARCPLFSGLEEEALEALLEQSDYVTIHIPLSDKTRNMIDESMLAKMKPSAALWSKESPSS